jgi:hypothetical protein
VVHTDALAYIALVDATTDWQHGSAQCLSGKDLSVYDFLSITKDIFIHVSVQLASNECAKECRVVAALHRAISVSYERYVRIYRGF